MNLQEITSLILNAADTVKNNEKLLLPVLAAKARKEAQARPTDVSLITASQVLTKMASNKNFITKDELADIINRFSTTQSKLTQVFSQELGKQDQGPRVFTRDSNEGVSIDHDYSRFVDPVLSNALQGAMEKTPLDKLYSSATAQKAHRAVHAQLLGMGAEPKRIETFAGRNDIIVCQASYDTPKGIAHSLIPVEIHEDKAVLPSLFLSRKGFCDLNKQNLIDHIKDVAGKPFKVDGSRLLDILNRVKNGEKEVVDTVKLAAIKMASERGSVATDSNGILYTQMDKPKSEVDLPLMPPTEESKFAEKLSKPEGVARFVHGDRVVEGGRAMLTRKFAEMGYHVQIKVAEVEENKIFYAVGIGTSAGVKVPVEINGNRVHPPKIVFTGDSVAPFNKTVISEVLSGGAGGNKRSLAMVSPCYGLKPSELVDIVKEAIAQGNYIKAEDAINVLGEIDPVAQRIAISHMITNIYEPGKEPGEDFQRMKEAASQPVQDVPQFMTHKVFFPEGA